MTCPEDTQDILVPKIFDTSARELPDLVPGEKSIITEQGFCISAEDVVSTTLRGHADCVDLVPNRETVVGAQIRVWLETTKKSMTEASASIARGLEASKRRRMEAPPDSLEIYAGYATDQKVQTHAGRDIPKSRNDERWVVESQRHAIVLVLSHIESNLVYTACARYKKSSNRRLERTGQYVLNAAIVHSKYQYPGTVAE